MHYTVFILIEARRLIQGSHRSGKSGKSQGKKYGQGKVREKSGNFVLGQKSGKSQGTFF